MPPVTNQMLNSRRERDCVVITTERKYIHVGGTWVKRGLRPPEWQTSAFGGGVMIPRFNHERIRNGAATMRFIAEKTNIPIPKLYGCFEDDDAVYLVMEYIEGMTMNNLDKEKRRMVEKEVETHLETLRGLKSSVWGGPSGLVIPPYRVTKDAPRLEWKMTPRPSQDLVFCHNDLGGQNIIVDPDTLKIKAIIDWEYAGFFPPEFEGMYFRRPGPSVTIGEEVDDEKRLKEIMYENEEK